MILENSSNGRTRRNFLLISHDASIPSASTTAFHYPKISWTETIIQKVHSCHRDKTQTVSELKNVNVRQIDIGSCRILLDLGTTKNDDGRVVKSNPGSVLAVLLAAC